ncbi:MAG: MerR family transcriptional regulator [Pseudomonadota bacterium]
MTKSADAFRTISEVADWLNTPAHVLRFWESKFAQVKPVKRAGGRRYYRPTDMKLLGGIKRLLHDDGMTIKGVQKLLREQGMAHVAGLSQPLGDAADDDELAGVVIDAEAQPVPEIDAGSDEPVAAETPDVATDAPAQEAVDIDPLPEAEPEQQAEPDTAPELEPAPEPVDNNAPQAQPVETAEASTQEVATAEQVDMSQPDRAAPDQSDAAVLPSFRHRRDNGQETEDLPRTQQPAEAADQIVAPEAASDVSHSEPNAPEPTTPAPAAPVIETPHLPDDASDDIPADPGVLSALAQLPQKVSPELAEQLRQIAAALRATKNAGGRQ